MLSLSILSVIFCAMAILIAVLSKDYNYAILPVINSVFQVIYWITDEVLFFYIGMLPLAVTLGYWILVPLPIEEKVDSRFSMIGYRLTQLCLIGILVIYSIGFYRVF